MPRMRIVIAGGTGLLGSRLVRDLETEGAEVIVLTRGASRNGHAVHWTPDGSVGAWAQAIERADAVINLAGESIAGKRWTPARKRAILESRTNATRSLVEAIARAAAPPAVFLSGSAVGYYGPLDDRRVTESSPPGSDFLAQVCVAWEKEAAAAANRTRVVTLRTGLVLSRDGGALPQMLPPFKFGVGGPVGSGTQYWPWIHIDDWAALVMWALRTAAVDGPVNLTAPSPVTNAEFAKALGRAMRRPALMPAPAFALRLLLGEMADALLLAGQRAEPDKAERNGFAFRYPDVGRALAALFP